MTDYRCQAQQATNEDSHQGNHTKCHFPVPVQYAIERVRNDIIDLALELDHFCQSALLDQLIDLSFVLSAQSESHKGKRTSSML
jgi:hypothetical protein